MKIWYMNGAGNDFMVMDARGLSFDFEKLATALCALRNADGFMAIDYSETADFRLHFYNSDGSRGEMCGNGSRCICRFAYENGIAGENMTMQTDAGIVYGRRLNESQYRVRLNDPGVLDLARKADTAYVELGCPGVPHGIRQIPGLRWEDREALRQTAKALRFDPAFPKGANINFYTWLGHGHIRILTYERGVEDYTLACGTGTASTACALFAAGKLPGKRLVAENPGGTLTVDLQTEEGRITAVYLEGPTEVVEIFETDIG